MNRPPPLAVFAYISILDRAGYSLLLSQEPSGLIRIIRQYYSNQAPAAIPLVVMTTDYYEAYWRVYLFLSVWWFPVTFDVFLRS